MDLAQLKEHPEFRSLAAIAAVCGVSRQAVHRWKKIPARCCPAIEAHTKRLTPDHVLTCEQLRPDLEWRRDETGQVTSYCVAVKKDS